MQRKVKQRTTFFQTCWELALVSIRLGLALEALVGLPRFWLQLV